MTNDWYPVMASSNFYYDFNTKQEINICLQKHSFVCVKLCYRRHKSQPYGQYLKISTKKDVDDDISLYNAGGIIIWKLIMTVQTHQFL